MSVELQYNEANRECRIVISGRFDFAIHQDFRQASEKATAKSGVKIVVDLRATDYVDSSALGMLLVLRDKAGEANKIRIVNAKPEVHKILKIANFDKLFIME